MDFQLTDEQAALVSAVQAILQDHAELPHSARRHSHYFDEGLQTLLEDNGYLNAGRDIGALEATLVAVEVARIPAIAEVAASALVVSQLLGDERLEGPVALISARDLHGAHRNLPVARSALIDLGDDVAVVPVEADNVSSVDSILAYPYGRFRHAPAIESARRLRGQGAKLRQWWRVALAAEIAGAAQAGVALTVAHVKQRHVFGHPIAAFQTVQHRLVQCHLVATASQYLALRAAWSGSSYDADVAACYAQQHVKKLLVDLHQFTGAMGVTNEFLLHFWTYRLRALQSEAGGMSEAARQIARQRWHANGESRSESGTGHRADARIMGDDP